MIENCGTDCIFGDCDPDHLSQCKCGDCQSCNGKARIEAEYQHFEAKAEGKDEDGTAFIGLLPTLIDGEEDSAKGKE